MARLWDAGIEGKVSHQNLVQYQIHLMEFVVREPDAVKVASPVPREG